MRIKASATRIDSLYNAITQNTGAIMGRIEKTVFISYRRTNIPWAQQDPDLESIRSDARFREIVGSKPGNQ